MTAKVRFQVTAGLYNDLLNHLRQNEIIIFDVVFDSFGFYATCNATDYRYIARQAKKYQTRTRIIKKSGLYFILKPFKERKGIIGGVILFYFLIYLFSGVIWRIDINAEDEILENNIAVQLYENGIFPGVFYNEDKFSSVQKKLILDNNISYVTMNFYKGVLVCKIRDSVEKEDYIADLKTEDLYATLSGIISDLRVYSGYSMVELGQGVSQGQLLVSSVHTDRHGRVFTSPVRAYVEAECEKTYSVTIPFEKQTEILTGRHTTIYTVFVFGIPFEFEGTEPYSFNNQMEKTKLEYISFLGFRLPVTVIKTEYYEIESVNLHNDILSARNIGRSQIDYMIKNDEKLMKEKERQYDYFINEDSLTVNCIVQGCYQIT